MEGSTKPLESECEVYGKSKRKDVYFWKAQEATEI
jgi:hypothetical protein